MSTFSKGLVLTMKILRVCPQLRHLGFMPCLNIRKSGSRHLWKLGFPHETLYRTFKMHCLIFLRGLLQSLREQYVNTVGQSRALLKNDVLPLRSSSCVSSNSLITIVSWFCVFFRNAFFDIKTTHFWEKWFILFVRILSVVKTTKWCCIFNANIYQQSFLNSPVNWQVYLDPEESLSKQVKMLVQPTQSASSPCHAMLKSPTDSLPI